MQASSDEIRVGVWQITQDLLKRTVLEHGCKFIPVPESAMDANGLLLEKYWAPDITHANKNFGELMLDQITSESGITHG